MPSATLPAPSAPPPPLPLHAQAYEKIKALILSGEIAPDSFLSERQLAHRLGMSKTPVHVALKRLESENFVLISPQQGVVVRGLAPADILDHYELRAVLEGYIVRSMAGRLDGYQIAALEKSLREQENALAEDDLARFVVLDADFHLLLGSFLGNRQILSTMEQLRDKIRLVVVSVVSLRRSRFEESVEEHRLITEHLVAGDGAAAESAVVAHLEAGKREILSPSNRSWKL